MNMRKLQLHNETKFLENDKMHTCFEKDFFLKSNDFFSENKLEFFFKLGWNYKGFAFSFYL